MQATAIIQLLLTHKQGLSPLTPYDTTKSTEHLCISLYGFPSVHVHKTL